MTRAPKPGFSVVLRDQRGASYRSEVLEGAPGELVLQPPKDLTPSQAFAPGTRLLVTWPDDQSLWVLPVMLVALRDADGVGLLVTEVNGDAWREERRHYVRSAIAANLTITDVGGEPAEGELVDLSEVALRCVVAPEHQRLTQPRTPVTVRLELDGDPFEIPGHVLLGKPAARVDLGLELVVLFTRPVARVDELRKHLADDSARG